MKTVKTRLFTEQIWCCKTKTGNIQYAGAFLCEMCLLFFVFSPFSTVNR